ncbi:MAG: T9SS type A sorting domain-containing protein [Lentimicrobiaceae bacterium]|jgi:parallel beta-helix repeat protein
MKKSTFLAVFITALLLFGFNQVGWGQAPATQAHDITFASVTGTGMTASWTNGDGTNRVVLINTTNSFSAPVDGTDPVANPVYGGSGEQVVYNGNGSSVSVTGLSYNTFYWFRVFEYNGTALTTLYNTSTGFINPFYQVTSPAGTLCGTKTVGVGGDYPTLTAAVADLNTKELCGALDLMLTDATYPGETFPIVINYNASSSSVNTITVKPAAGISPTIICNTANAAIILNAANYVVIDGSNQVGGSSKDLTLSNTYAGDVTNSVVLLKDITYRAVTNSTIKNCIINGNSTVVSSYAINMNNEVGEVFNNITITNNTIKNAKVGIRLISAKNNIISANIIGDAVDPLTKGGIEMSYCDSTFVLGNDIFGEIAGNLIRDKVGINMGVEMTNSKIRNNKIHDFYYNGTDGYGCWGINYNGEANSITEISNNLIFNIKSTGALPSNGSYWLPSGIRIVSGGNIQIYFNSINMTGNVLGTLAQSNFAGASACLAIDNGVTNLDARNNIFKNSMTTADGTGANKTYGLLLYSAFTAFANIDNNDYYINGMDPKIAYLAGGDVNTLTDWQTITSKDANSVSTNPGFISSIDLHASLVGPNNKGIAISGISVDYAGVTRSDPPDMGAYEYSMFPSVTTDIATGVTATGVVLNGSVNANNESATGNFEYGLTTAYGSTIAWAPSPATGSASTLVSSTLTGLLPNTTYHFRVNGTTIAGLANGSDLSFTTDAIPAVVTTNNASNIDLTSAQLNGTVTANYAATDVSFEWGLTTSYGNTVAATPATVNGVSATPVLANLTGLSENTTYHYRCVGVNLAGTTNGDDLTFKTLCTLPFATGIITGSATVCQGQTSVTYTVPDIANATSYVWTLPTGAVGTSSSNSITVDFGLTAVSGNITVTGHNDCGDGTVSTLAIAVNPLPSLADVITGLATVCQGQAAVTYTVPVIANAISYIWTLPTGATGTSSTNSISVDFGLTAVSGNITVTGHNDCGDGTVSTLAITVNPLPSLADVITGSATVCQGQAAVTYTVPAIASATSYIWTLPAGATGTSSTNSINVDFGLTAVSGNVTVTGHNDCGDGTVSTLAIAVNPLPSLADVITGLATVCQGQAAVTYTVPAIANATSYIWTLPAGATGTSSTNSITVDFGLTAVSGNITVSGHNDCGDGTVSTLAIAVNPLPSLADVITGSPTVCQGQSAVTYTVPVIANATSYIWTLPTGATGTSSTNSITVDFGSTAVSGNITVAGHNDCGDGTVSTLAITVNPLPTLADVITGSATVCQGEAAVTYTVPAIANATSYVWTLPTGATGTSSTNSITVDFGSTAVTGNITVTGHNDCGDGTVSTLAITVNPLPSLADVITGLTTVCQGQTSVTYTVPDIANATSYVWTLPTGATGTSSTNSITVDFSSTAVSGNIIVAGHNDCGDGTVSTLAITVNPLPSLADVITGSAIVCLGQTSVTYTVPAIASATSYIWTLPAGAVGTSSTNSITVDFGSTAVSGNITVAGHNDCGDGTVSTLAITVNPIPPTPVISQTENTLSSDATAGNQWYWNGVMLTDATAQTYIPLHTGSYSVNVTLSGCSSELSNIIEVVFTGVVENVTAHNVSTYPNPSHGHFTLSITSAKPEVYDLRILNPLGITVYQRNSLFVNGTLKEDVELRNLPLGVYSVVLNTVDRQIIRKIVID